MAQFRPASVRGKERNPCGTREIISGSSPRFLEVKHMAKQLDRDLVEQILARYFEKTTPIFDAEMGKRLAGALQTLRKWAK